MITITISGLVGHLGVGRQENGAKIKDADLETYLEEGAITDYFVITEESFTTENNPLVAENEIGRGRDRTGAIAGGYGITGGFGGYARVYDLALLCHMSLSQGDFPSPPASPAEQTISIENYLDFYTVEKNVGDKLWLWLVNGKVNTLTISINQGEIGTYTTDWVVTTEISLEEEPETPDYIYNDLLAFHGGMIYIGTGGSSELYENMESVEIALNNNLSNDEYTVHPSRFLNDVTEGPRTMDLNFDQVFQDPEDYEKYTYGEIGRKSPGYNLYEDEVEFTLMNAQEKDEATQYIVFNFPRVMFGGLPVTLTSGRITVANTGVCLASAKDIVEITYKTST